LLGRCYEEGKGKKINEIKAMELITKAAELGI
jgi:TPR repeat protein